MNDRLYVGIGMGLGDRQDLWVFFLSMVWFGTHSSAVKNSEETKPVHGIVDYVSSPNFYQLIIGK